MQSQIVLKENKTSGLSGYSIVMGILFLFMLVMQILALFGVEFIGFAPVDVEDVEASLDNIVNGAVILLVYFVLTAIFMGGFTKSKKGQVDGLGFVAGGVILVMIIGAILILTNLLAMIDWETFDILITAENAGEFFRWEYIAFVLGIPGLMIIKNRNQYLA